MASHVAVNIAPTRRLRSCALLPQASLGATLQFSLRFPKLVGARISPFGLQTGRPGLTLACLIGRQARRLRE
jgi:hypothetical protein